jgi:two-component system sensor histidine kinase/response regulator
MTNIRQAVTVCDHNQTLALAHTLKGLAGAIGAETLAATAREFEDAVREGKKLALPDLLDTMARQMAEVFQAAVILESTGTRQAAADQPGEAATIDRDALARAVGELRMLLSLNRVSAAGKFKQLKSLLPDTVERVALEKQIGGFDFKGAQTTLKRLAKTIGIVIEV